jgi:hypothetical protein
MTGGLKNPVGAMALYLHNDVKSMAARSHPAAFAC